MSRYDADGGRIPTDLFEAAAWHYSVVATCRACRREGVFHAAGLWWLFHRKGWDYGFAAAARRFKCRQCGRKGWIMALRNKPITVPLPLPDERAWKRAVSRFRS